MDARLLNIGALLAGSALDLAWGDPAWLPHPIVGYGKAIACGERLLNRGRARWLKGLLLTLLLVVGTFSAWVYLLRFSYSLQPAVAFIFTALGVFFALAHRTLLTEGRRVFSALAQNLEAGRASLSRIVGRDTAELDEQEVRTAVFETMAENLSDGVVAPLFWYAVLGLPGMMAYKMVNTLDSMIGHRNDRFEWFGKAAARLDDLANLFPARLTAVLLVLVSPSRRAAGFVLRYGNAHESPNSGYPEAALAGILDLRFGGPTRYEGEWLEKPWIGLNSRKIQSSEIERVVRLNHAVATLTLALVVMSLWIRK